MRNLYAIIVPITVVVTAGCASSFPAPTQGMTDAEAAQRSAQELGAAGQPEAQLHLRLAEEQIAQAKVAMQSGDNQRASDLLVRARADAELAISLVREQSVNADAQRVMDQLNRLRSTNQGAQP